MTIFNRKPSRLTRALELMYRTDAVAADLADCRRRIEECEKDMHEIRDDIQTVRVRIALLTGKDPLANDAA